ncbi:MAG TPA: argininosuccinate lyase, partial [Chitinophagaceae bacterium]
SVEAVNELVNKGVPFREAYKAVGEQIESGTFSFDPGKLRHTHEGSIGNLQSKEIRRLMDQVLTKFR